ncbi:MAG TPA: ankyrin repeat domain-containing protein [Flavitalea sp.]|nr:ankyrin repeat domain-containing protein [Flavitalea sp.]
MDVVFRNAVEAIDAGDIGALTKLVKENPGVLSEKLITSDEGYFKDPYLLYFVADNPIRNEKLPANIVAVTKFLINELKAKNVTSLQNQLDYTLGLITTGRISREYGVQIELIDLLIDEGAAPGGGLGALAHGNIDAARHLIKRGGELVLATAVGLEMTEDIKRLLPIATEAEKLSALTVAAFYGKPEMISRLLSSGANPNGYPEGGFHSHATPLHQAVSSGSLEAVKLLVQAGADLIGADRAYNGTSLGWAMYMQTEEGENEAKKDNYAAIETYLKTKK